MTQATGARSQVSLVEELVWGVTPATPELTSLPFSSFNMGLKKDFHENTSIQADGMQRSPTQGNRSVGGDLDAQFSAADFKLLFEGLMQNDITTGTLKKGNLRKSYTFQEFLTDVNQVFVTRGVLVDKMAFTVSNTGVATIKFSLIGKTHEVATVSLDTTITVAPDQKILHHSKGVFKEGGVAVGYFSSYTINVDNGYATNYGLGNDDPRDFTANTQKVTGSVKVFFEDAVMLKKFIDGTPSSLEAVYTDAAGNFGIKVPNLMYSSADKPISGSGPVELTLNFTGSVDAATNANIIFTF